MGIVQKFTGPSIWIGCSVVFAFTFLQLTKLSEALPYEDKHYQNNKIEGTPAEDFPFYGKIVQPCDCKVASSSNAKFCDDSDSDSNPSTSTLSRGLFYQNAAKAIKEIQNKIGDVTLANEEESYECYGMSPYALPITHPLENLTENEIVTESYKYGVYLAAFWRLMELDREIKPEATEHIFRYRYHKYGALDQSLGFTRCGNETSHYAEELGTVASTMEEFLCLVTSGASKEQKRALQEVVEKAKKQPMFHSRHNCARLGFRDCYALKGTIMATKLMLKGFLTLAESKGIGVIEGVIRDDYELTEIESDMINNHEMWEGDTF